MAAQCPAAPELPPVQRQLRLSCIDMKVTCPRSSPLTSASSSLPVPASGHATLPPPVHCILWKRWPARQVLPHRRDDGPVIQFLDRRMLSVRQETAWKFEMGVGSGRPRMARSGRRPLVEQAARSIPKCRWMSSEERTPESSQLVGILTFGQRSDSVQFPSSRTMQTWVASSGLLRQGQWSAGPDRRSDGGLNDALGEGKEAPRFNSKIRRCSPVLLSERVG